MAFDTDRDNQNRLLKEIYDAIPRHYRLTNSIITWGLDHRWRRKAADECLAGNPQKVFDAGCGTGDLTLELLRKSGGAVEITGIDFNHNMMRIAEERVARAGGDRVSFISGDAANLPFPSEYFESIGTAFAFRNMTYKNPMAEQHTAELLRVLKTGGRFVVVETSQPKLGLLKRLCHFYVRCSVSLAGALISGSRQPYRYLTDSVLNYFTPEELQRFLQRAGFRQVTFYRLLFGAASIHLAIK